MDTDRRAIVAAYLFNVGDFVVGPDFTLRRDNYSGIDSNFRDSISGTTDSTAPGVRAGYPIGRFMPFVSARIGRGTDDVDSNDRSFDFDTHEWGMGAEVVLRERTSLLVSYDRVTFDYRDINLEIDSDAFSLGLGFRF